MIAREDLHKHHVEMHDAVMAHYAAQDLSSQMRVGSRVAIAEGKWLRCLMKIKRARGVRTEWWEVEDQDAVRFCVARSLVERLAMKEYVRIMTMIAPLPPLPVEVARDVRALLQGMRNAPPPCCTVCGLEIKHAVTHTGWVHKDVTAWVKNRHTAQQPREYSA